MGEPMEHHDEDHQIRPQSRASQYSAQSIENSSGYGLGHGGNPQHRQQHYTGSGQSQSLPYQLQQLQFDKPSEDDMW